MGAALSSVIVLASEEGGTDNFLIPNGTFFFVLAIFLVVFGVIAKFVVVPVQKVLQDRENMIAKTTQDNRLAAEQDAAANSEYASELTSARSEAGSIRDQARSEGRQVIDDLRTEASDEVAGKLKDAGDVLSREGAALTPGLAPSVEQLSEALAARILGTDAGSRTTDRQGQ